MLPLILAPLLTTLAQNGLGMLASAITSKGKAVIEEKLGVNIEDFSKTEEGLLKLKALEFEHEEFLIEAAQKKAENELKDKALDIDNTKNARDSNARIQESDKASWIAKNSAYMLDWLLVGSTIGMLYMLFTKAIPVENAEIAYLATGSLLTMCGTVVNFNRGSSSGSASRTEALVNLMRSKG